MTPPSSPRVRTLGPNSYLESCHSQDFSMLMPLLSSGGSYASLTWEKASSRNLDTYLLT